MRSIADFDVVIPNDNEEELIAQALLLGYKEIVFLTNNINYIKPLTDKLCLKTAYMLNDTSDISRLKKRFDYTFANAERKYFESKVDFIVGVESSDRKDSFHYKATSLNQVHAELAKKNEITLVFNFGRLVDDPLSTKGKMSQNALLIKKYKLKHAAFSLATKPSMMRSHNVLRSLEKLLGL
jgi:hypothetical protein